MNRFVFLIALPLLLPFPAQAGCTNGNVQYLHGRVVNVWDGDTVDIVLAQKPPLRVLIPPDEKVRVRLTEIDAPERDQPFYAESRQMLSDMVLGKNITVIKTGTDKYGRTLGRIFPSSSDISLQMAEQGGAWSAGFFQCDPYFNEIERKAKKEKTGLWDLPPDDLIPPSQWRRDHPRQKHGK